MVPRRARHRLAKGAVRSVNTFAIEYLIHLDAAKIDGRIELSWWAESPQLAGWTAVADDLDQLRSFIRESQAVFFEAPVPYTERLAGKLYDAAELAAHFGRANTAASCSVKYASVVYANTGTSGYPGGES